MLKAIDTVMSGESFYGSEVVSIMTQSLTASEDGNQGGNLSNREKEVPHYVAKEYTNQEISDTIEISVRTVETHKRNLIKKLRVKNVVGLVRFALEKGPLLGLD
jgi:DNA-binding NarL/FixJ family response regulator